jgi:hypothetical protein
MTLIMIATINVLRASSDQYYYKYCCWRLVYRRDIFMKTHYYACSSCVLTNVQLK